MMRTFLSNPSRWVWVLAAVIGLVLVQGLRITLMDVDASQYASISMEMLQNGHWLEVKHHLNDYLDKPPLLFWVSAVSMQVFGLHTWAYKLPSVLGALVGVWAVYRFSLLYYTRTVALQAALILASCIGFFLLCNDVRTDTLLMGTTAAAVGQLAAFLKNNYKKQVLAAGFWIGLAMLAKGPIGLVLPVCAIGTHLICTRYWRGIFRWEWLLALPVIALLLFPMCYGLYQQFDLHPEKVINERSGVSGLYFYFWEQSFGRVTGENVWKNETSAFYFLHVVAWAFLPWTWWLLRGLWYTVKQRAQPEYFSIGAFTLIFIALSQSQYKLPHYIFVVLPWAAVLTARAWNAMNLPRWWGILNTTLLLLLVAVAALLPGYVFAPAPWWIWVVGSLLAVVALYWAWPNPTTHQRWFWGNLTVGILVGWVLNFHFYPQLLPYQSSSTAGQWLRAQGIQAGQVAAIGRSGHALDFYAGQIVPFLTSKEAAQEWVAEHNPPLWIYVREDGWDQLDATGIPYETVLECAHFQPALLHLRFLNPHTRPGTLQRVGIVKIEKNTPNH